MTNTTDNVPSTTPERADQYGHVYTYAANGSVATVDGVSVRESAPPVPAPEGGGEDRDTGGRLVREAWIRWAQAQPSPKASWLAPYDDLSEPDKEADRQIAEALWSAQAERIAGLEAKSAALTEDARDLLNTLRETHGALASSTTSSDYRSAKLRAVGMLTKHGRTVRAEETASLTQPQESTDDGR